MKNNELINLLEEDMHGDLKSMDSPSDKEVDISIDEVKGWYFEAEKLISVLRNILDAPMTQSINQLRYAGHHILKAQTDKDEEITQSNLVEAFKHCKRAVYDAIDLYVYKFKQYIYDTHALPCWPESNKIRAIIL